MAKNYSDNLSEEVKNGIGEKAEQRIYTGSAPLGYRNNKAERTIEVDAVDSKTVNRLFELYATGSHTLSSLAKAIRSETGRNITRPTVYWILKNRFLPVFSSGVGKSMPVNIRS